MGARRPTVSRQNVSRAAAALAVAAACALAWLARASRPPDPVNSRLAADAEAVVAGGGDRPVALAVRRPDGSEERQSLRPGARVRVVEDPPGGGEFRPVRVRVPQGPFAGTTGTVLRGGLRPAR